MGIKTMQEKAFILVLSFSHCFLLFQIILIYFSYSSSYHVHPNSTSIVYCCSMWCQLDCPEYTDCFSCSSRVFTHITLFSTESYFTHQHYTGETTTCVGHSGTHNTHPNSSSHKRAETANVFPKADLHHSGLLSQRVADFWLSLLFFWAADFSILSVHLTYLCCIMGGTWKL